MSVLAGLEGGSRAVLHNKSLRSSTVAVQITVISTKTTANLALDLNDLNDLKDGRDGGPWG